MVSSVTQNFFPNPPKDFRATSEVELAYGRWYGYRKGREPLQSMAYFVLTLLEVTAGRRNQASRTFHIDQKAKKN